MRRPGAPFNSLYSKSGGENGALNNSFDSTYPSTGFRGQSPPSMTRRPQSAMAGGHYASRRLSEPEHKSVYQSNHQQAGNLKMQHLSLSRKIIELWDMLEVPPHRRQASIGTSMVMLYPTAANVAQLRALVDELEAYRVTREQSAQHIFSTLGGLPDASFAGGNVYRPHPLDEVPLAMRRPVSASLMRGSPSALFGQRGSQQQQQRPLPINGGWSRPTSALSDRSLIDDVPYIAATAVVPTSIPPTKVDQSHVTPSKLASLQEGTPATPQAAVDSRSECATPVSTKNRPPSAKLRSILPEPTTAATINATSSLSAAAIDPPPLSQHISTATKTVMAANEDESATMPNAVAAAAAPPLKGNTRSLVDAATMTIESYLVQDSAVVKELFYMEEVHRHDLEEQCNRPISKLNLLFLTRVTDIEERALRGITRSDRDRKAAKAADGELFDAITGGPAAASAGSQRDEAEVYALAASRIKRLMMEEAMARIGITESAERIAEIEFAFVVTRVEEEASRASLCGVLEESSWTRLIHYFRNSLSTTLFQGLPVIQEAFLRRYDLEREEHFDRTAVEDNITRQLSVLRWASSLYSEETKARRALLQEEFVADAVLDGAIKKAEAEQRNAKLMVIAAQETDARYQVFEESQNALKELENAHQRNNEAVERLLYRQTNEKIAAARALTSPAINNAQPAAAASDDAKSEGPAANEQVDRLESTLPPGDSEVQLLTQSSVQRHFVSREVATIIEEGVRLSPQPQADGESTNEVTEHLTQSGVQRNYVAGEVAAIIDEGVRLSPQRQTIE